MIYFDHDFYQRCGAATFFGRLQMSEVPEPTSALASFPAWRVAPPAGGRTGSPAVIINKGHYLLYQNIENIQTSTRISVRQDDHIMFIIRQDTGTVLNVTVYRRLDTGNG